MLIRRLVSTTILLVLAGCAKEASPAWPPQASVRYARLGIPTMDGQPDLSAVEIRMSRSRCYGWCPSYEVTLSGSGQGKYVGEHDVIVEGRVDFTFEPHALLAILDILESLDFMEMSHTGDSVIFDAPVATTTVTIAGRTASFGTAWVDCCDSGIAQAHADFHRRYVSVTDAVDRVANIERMIGSDEKRRERFSTGY